ncbi:MAG TPA: IS4 family transposase [Planctomycetota bacterium]|jgi:hypothetical protein
MEENLVQAGRWAALNFGGAELGDRRSTRRLVEVATRLVAEPTGSLHRALPTWSELVGAYRLLGRPKTNFDAVARPHQKRTQAACREAGDYLLIEDTTSLDFTSHEATKGLGRIGDDGGRGLHLHSNLALRIESWSAGGPLCSVVGFFHQKCWARTTQTIGFGNEPKRKRLKRPRESMRWAEAYESSDAPPPGTRWTHVGDRETDIYEAFERCEAKGFDWLVRACQARALADNAGSVFSAVAAAEPVGRVDLELRARPGQLARTAHLSVRTASVRLRSPWRPGRSRDELSTHVVEVREEAPPPGADALCWVLLTSWPAATFEEALRVVGAYACRPIIEEFHRSLKSGVTNVEESQLKTANALRALTAILSPIALKMLDLRAEVLCHPEARLKPGAVPPLALQLLAKRLGHPVQDWTWLAFTLALAQLGGFKARASDGLPGWNTLWRGWHKLMIMMEGVELFSGSG